MTSVRPGHVSKSGLYSTDKPACRNFHSHSSPWLGCSLEPDQTASQGGAEAFEVGCAELTGLIKACGASHSRPR